MGFISSVLRKLCWSFNVCVDMPNSILLLLYMYIHFAWRGLES